MDVITSLSSLPENLRGAVLAFGNFDGVHLGHRALLSQARNMADAKGLKLGVLTFEPHPRKLFCPDDPPFRITPPDLKHRLLGECSVDFIVSLPFDWDFASQSAEDFVWDVLVKGLDPIHVFVGEDFQFGQLRKGNPDTIASAGVAITKVTPVGMADTKYASTDIREALRLGDIASANAILGWDWEMGGEIVRGDRRGHDLGYPTANVPIGDILHPAYGVYATLVQIEGETTWRAAATNIGIRPMFELKVGQIEAHILDFQDIDIYGKNLRVKPIKRLRGEAKFGSLETLIAQIEADCTQTRKILT